MQSIFRAIFKIKHSRNFVYNSQTIASNVGRNGVFLAFFIRKSRGPFIRDRGIQVGFINFQQIKDKRRV
jgi:hypothetical protein